MSRLKLYVMQLTELTDCSSSILMVQRSRKNGFPFLYRIKRGAMHEQIATAFQANGEVGQVTVHHLTSISLMATMHEDICHVAGKKGVAMIILPFHKRWGREDEEVTEDSGQEGMNKNLRPVMSLGKECIIFIGGPYDRKVLELGSRMAEHPAIRLLLVRFTSYKEARGEGPKQNSPTSTTNWEKEKELDEEAINEFKAKWQESVEYIEKNATNITEEVLSIGKAKDYDLVIVGKQQQIESTKLTNIDFRPEH
ncbi:Cation/H(+) antiporter 20 [Glycine soja]|uniref:Cation/H(+) antiporter 20 n=1 Tax=Glycine soja TaxID=3848 RepID=A0A445FHW1_GLYSO|nr:Cation/H(+) antiporter 20 [Glycine soja]